MTYLLRHNIQLLLHKYVTRNEVSVSYLQAAFDVYWKMLFDLSFEREFCVFVFQIIIFVVFKGTPATQPFFTNFIQNVTAIGTPLINAVRLNAQLYCKTEIKQTNLLLRLRFLSVN